jgi:hypothetical protein
MLLYLRDGCIKNTRKKVLADNARAKAHAAKRKAATQPMN